MSMGQEFRKYYESAWSIDLIISCSCVFGALGGGAKCSMGAPRRLFAFLFFFSALLPFPVDSKAFFGVDGGCGRRYRREFGTDASVERDLNGDRVITDSESIFLPLFNCRDFRLRSSAQGA